jgi:hypothetical protein
MKPQQSWSQGEREGEEAEEGGRGKATNTVQVLPTNVKSFLHTTLSPTDLAQAVVQKLEGIRGLQQHKVVEQIAQEVCDTVI